MPVQPIAVAFADSHLADRAWAGREIKGDAYYSLNQIVTWAIEHKLPVIGAGDLIDKQLNRSTPIVYFNQEMDRLQAAELAFYGIQGQHEYEDLPWITSHRWPTHVSARRFTIETVDFIGLDYQAPIHLQIALNALEKADILVAHQVWGEFMGSIANPQGGFGDVPNVRSVITGDYHVYKQITTRGKDGQQLQVVSPGSTCLQSIDEPTDKYLVVVMEDCTFKRVRLKTRSKLEWTILGQADMDTFMHQIESELQGAWDATVGYPEHIRKPILWITYGHRVAEDIRRRVSEAVKDRGYIFWKEIPPEKPEVQERRETARSTGQRRATTLDGALAPYLKEQERQHLEGDCRRLLTTHDVPGELRRMREEALQ